MTERQQFRQALVQSLKLGLEQFDLAHLQETHAVSSDVARQAARDVFFSQCLKATEDWTITDTERQVLHRLGERLQLSPREQTECLSAAKNRVFETELQEALDDDMISNAEANSLAHLRTTLGLEPMAAEEFGPPLKRPVKRQENLFRKHPETRSRPTERGWPRLPFRLLGPRSDRMC